jgi:hypothetical protein
MKVTTTGGGYPCIQTLLGAVTISNINFGVSSGVHMSVLQGGQIFASGNYTVSGGATAHIDCQGVSYVSIYGLTITLSGTPAFSNCFLNAVKTCTLGYGSNTFSGSATGKRFNVDRNAVIDIIGATPNTYVPGNSNGTTSNGGLCV